MVEHDRRVRPWTIRHSNEGVELPTIAAIRRAPSRQRFETIGNPAAHPVPYASQHDTLRRTRTQPRLGTSRPQPRCPISCLTPACAARISRWRGSRRRRRRRGGRGPRVVGRGWWWWVGLRPEAGSAPTVWVQRYVGGRRGAGAHQDPPACVFADGQVDRSGVRGASRIKAGLLPVQEPDELVSVQASLLPRVRGGSAHCCPGFVGISPSMACWRRSPADRGRATMDGRGRQAAIFETGAEQLEMRASRHVSWSVSARSRVLVCSMWSLA